MSDEWVMVPREPTAEQLVDGAYEVPDPISHRGELTARMVYRAMLDAAPAAPQQTEPVAQIGWADEFGNLFPMGAWKPTQRTHHDSHKTAWRPVFLHPPAAEVQRLRNSLRWAIREIERSTCTHEETHRRGPIWTICDHCDSTWADDEGGFVPYVEPPELIEARAALEGVKP